MPSNAEQFDDQQKTEPTSTLSKDVEDLYSDKENTISKGIAAHVMDYIDDKFHDPSGKTYIRVKDPRTGATLTYSVHSKDTAMLIRQIVWKLEGRGINTKKVEEIQDDLAAAAAFDGICEDVHIRVAKVEEAVEIDLGDESGRCLRVDKGNATLTQPTAAFIRPTGSKPIPFDIKAKPDFGKLWNHINVEDQTDRVLVASWLLSTLRGKGPYPILAIQGEQGSAKSTASKMLRCLVDPMFGEARSLPRNLDDLFIAAQHRHLLDFDNLSGMKHELSDGFCMISTGGAFAKRKHYSNSGEIVHEACNPVLFNGIDDLFTRPDLHSRAFVIRLPRIPEDKRKDEETVWADFERDRPAIFNGLIKALRDALKRYPDVELAEAPRMADVAKFATAAERSFGFEDGAVIDALNQRQQDARLSSIEVDPVAPRIIDYFKPAEGRTAPQVLEGTPTEIWERLTPAMDKPSNWPKTASHFSGHLSRITPDLRSVGIIVDRPPRSSNMKSVRIYEEPQFTKD